RERAERFRTYPFHVTVVQIEMRHFHTVGQRRRVDRVVVVLARDLHLPGVEIANRMVATVMPEGQFERLGTERETHDLMTKTDPEHRHLSEQFAHVALRAGRRRGIARTVRQEHAVGLPIEHFLRGRPGWYDLDLATDVDELIENRTLDPEVVRDDVVTGTRRPDRVRLARGHLDREVAAVGAAVFTRRGEQRVTIGGA